MDHEACGSFCRPNRLLADLERVKNKLNSNANSLVGNPAEISNDDEILVKKSRLDPGVDPRNDFNSDSEIKSFQEPLNMFVSLDSLPPGEAVFSIAKIRKLILSYSQPEDLLQFRLVSREWRVDATNKTLFNWKPRRICIYECNKTKEAYALSNRTKIGAPLKKLTNLMDASGTNPFPCANFIIWLDNKFTIDSKLEAFLSRHGPRIKEIKMFLTRIETCERVENNPQRLLLCSNTSYRLQQFVTKLLGQMPNLDNFVIDIKSLSLREKRNCKPCNDFKVSNNVPVTRSPSLHWKLSTVLLSKSVPQSVFALICELAPNLKEVITDNFEFYVEPLNRLNLCKRLLYYPSANYPNENILQKVVNTDGYVMSLKELSIKIKGTYRKPEKLFKVADICNKLLKQNSHSLTTLTCTPVGFLPEFKFKVPRMPNINHLLFHSYSTKDSPKVNFFPQGLSFSETFPNLLTVSLRNITNEISGYDWFFCGKNQVVSSVKLVINQGKVIDSRKIRRLFPNAKIT